MNKKRGLQLFLIYTGLFCVAFGMNYFLFFKTGTSFLWSLDGSKQHYPALVYIGKFYRSLFTGGTYNPYLMLGGDTLVTLNYYGLGDPLTILSAFVPSTYTEYLYSFLVVLRFYLAGWSFIFLCRYYKKDYFPAMAGAFVYIFCGYAACFAIRHPFFLNPMIQFPLLIVGADQILKKKKSWLFPLAVCYSALCGFYFAYMMTLLLGVFVLVRFFDDRKEFFQKIFSMALHYIVGILMASLVFVPSVLGFLNNSDRSGMEEGGLDFLYDKTYYILKIGRLMAPCGSENILAMSTIILPAFILLLFRKKNGKRTLLLLTVVSFVIYSVPLLASTLNGFSYSSNRWTFAFSLLLAYITVDAIRDFMNMKKREVLCLAIGTLGIAAFEYLAYKKGYWQGVSLKPGLLFLVGVFVLCFALFLLSKIENLNKYLRPICYGFVLLFVIANTAVFTYCKFSPQGQNTIKEYLAYGDATSTEEAEKATAEFLSGDDSFYRVSGNVFTRNRGMLYNIANYSSYWSIINSNVSDLWNETENSDMRSDFNIYGIDQHTILSTLLGNKYDVQSANSEQYPPYGYTLIGSEAGYNFYENENTLPLGYTYDSYITYDMLSELNGLEKEQTMLSTVALEEASENVESGNVSSDVSYADLSVVASDGVEVADGSLTATKKDATITFSFELPEGAEGYLSLQNAEIASLDGTSMQSPIDVSCDGYTNSIRILSKNHIHYTGKADFLCNLGYSETGHTTVTLTFNQTGILTYDQLCICYQTFENYESEVAERGAEALENISLSGNTLTGTCDVSEDKILVIALPYEKGWTAKVDGEEVSIQKANYMFMAVELEAGSHTIEFTYHTRGFALGVLMTLFGLLGFFFIFKFYKKEYN